jgi:ubiquinone/menaquinone biosynthesis C-methylase UbiE
MSSVRVLDVGGTEQFWSNAWDKRCERLNITLLNVTSTTLSGDLPLCSIIGDARDLSRFGDKEFDLCFSNSVIEHVGTLEDQQRMAKEVRRVAQKYFIQTPYRYFFIEPHWHFPLWAQLPTWFRVALHRNMNLGWLRKERDYLQARIDVEQIRLISLKEFHLLFPDGEISRERVGPFIKSMIAIRG